MKTIYKTTILLLLLQTACSEKQEMKRSGHEPEESGHHDDEHREASEEVHLSQKQVKALGIKMDTLPLKHMHNFVETNGQLTLPPQSEAAVTSIIGANIGSIEVIEGRKVQKGQTLAFLYHPSLIELQTEYANQMNRLAFVEQEYKRQQKLYAESVGSGRDFQKIKSEYLSLKGDVEGIEAKLKLLSISPKAVQSGDISERIALKSPITGYVQHIGVKTGQYVAPEEVLFEIIQNDHIHAHFKVFENDIQLIKNGQKIQFVVESQPEVQHEAVVFAVGKRFETEVKAINVHAEMENEDESLLPGMYAKGQILLDDQQTYALPKDAVATDGDRQYIFTGQRKLENGEEEWHFRPIEISTGVTNGEWVEIKLHNKLAENTQIAWTKAYYLISELNKEEGGHHH